MNRIIYRGCSVRYFCIICMFYYDRCIGNVSVMICDVIKYVCRVSIIGIIIVMFMYYGMISVIISKISNIVSISIY